MSGMCTSANVQLGKNEIVQQWKLQLCNCVKIKLRKDENVRGSGVKIASVQIGHFQAMQDCAKSICETCMCSRSNCSKAMISVKAYLCNLQGVSLSRAGCSLADFPAVFFHIFNFEIFHETQIQLQLPKIIIRVS